MDYGVPILIAVLGPLVTGLVTAAGIALERRRTEHDLEVRRLRLVELARNQIEAVQPLLNSPSADGVGTDSRERANSIVVSALDSLLHAQALTRQEETLQQRAAKVVERHSGSVTSELLLRRPLRSPGARILRVIYYLAFTWGGLGLLFFGASVFTLPGAGTDAASVVGFAVSFVLTGLLPVLLLRKAVLGCERRYSERKSTRHEVPPPPPPPPAPYPYHPMLSQPR